MFENWQGRLVICRSLFAGGDMPFVRRNPSGRVVALLETPDSTEQETLSSSHPDVLAFLGQDETKPDFRELDADFVRVTEDLIYVLMEKGVLQFTDLPADAQRKLRAREGFRGRRLKDALDLLGDGDEQGLI